MSVTTKDNLGPDVSIQSRDYGDTAGAEDGGNESMCIL